MRRIFLISLLLASPLSASEVPTPAPKRTGPEITYLANEGFLLTCGATRVVIDAFVIEPYSEYAAVPAETWKRMLERQAPFETVALALVSHVHRDHVQPEPAVRFLTAHPETRLITSPEVVAALRAVEGFDAVAERVESALPEPGETVTREVALGDTGQIRVDFLRLLHANERNREIENLGHLIYLCGETVLHVGDAMPQTRSFAPYRLGEGEIDVALLPFWFYLSEEGRELVTSLGAGSEAACHVPHGEHARWNDAVAEQAPGVQVLGRSGEAVAVLR